MKLSSLVSVNFVQGYLVCELLRCRTVDFFVVRISNGANWNHLEGAKRLEDYSNLRRGAPLEGYPEDGFTP
jgi:hypothetical protein